MQVDPEHTELRHPMFPQISLAANAVAASIYQTATGKVQLMAQAPFVRKQIVESATK